MVQKHPALYSITSYCGSDFVTRLVLVTVVVVVRVVMGMGDCSSLAVELAVVSLCNCWAGLSCRIPVGVSLAWENKAGSCDLVGKGNGAGLYVLMGCGAGAGVGGGAAALVLTALEGSLDLFLLPPPPKKPLFFFLGSLG